MTKFKWCVAAFAVALAGCASSAAAQGAQGPQGIRALTCHFGDQGIVITEQFRMPSKFTFEIDGVLVGGIHRIDGIECYPTKWAGPDLNSKTSAHATEYIEILFERMELK